MKRIRIEPYVEVPLTQGQVAKIDAVDAALVSQFTWHAAYSESVKSYYAVTATHKTDTEASRTLYMHRLIMGAPKGMTVDHLNHDTLDNRRCNLKLCGQSVNGQNRKQIDPRSKTGVRNVSIHTTSDGTRYYVAKVGVVKWFDGTEAGKAEAEVEAARLRTALTSEAGKAQTTGRKGNGTALRKGRWIATASRTQYFPYTDEGLAQAAMAAVEMRRIVEAL